MNICKEPAINESCAGNIPRNALNFRNDEEFESRNKDQEFTPQ